MDKQQAHTPGPWKDAGEFIIGSDNTTICQARDEESWDANARLIASAPDLLAERDRLREALESVVHACEIGGAMTGQAGCIHRTATAALKGE